MTTFEPALTMLAAWLRPVLPIVNAETIEQCGNWAIALAQSEEVTAEDLSLAAFGHASDDLIRTLETAITHITATYSPEGKAEFISYLSAATLLQIVDDGGDPALEIVGCCESLLFLGWKPVIEDLPARLRDFAAAQARKTRERIPIDATVKPIRRRTIGDEDALEAALNETQSLLNRTVERLNTVVDQFNSRLALVDEEVDTLWWARSERSVTTGQAWSDLGSLDRAVVAGIEVAEIVGSRPPAAGTVAVLDQVIGTSNEVFDLVDVVAALHKVGWTGCPARNKSHAPFRPLAAGIESFMQFNNNEDVVAQALSASLLVPDGHKVTASEVVHQLLNENALQDDDD